MYVLFFLFKSYHLQFNQLKFSWNPKLIQTISIPIRLKEILRQCDKSLLFIVLGDCNSITNGTLIGFEFLFLNWWSLSVSVMAWAKKISFKVYKKSLIILSNIGLEKAELLPNSRRLFELELRKNCGTFLYFIFWSFILNEYEK